MKDIYLILVLLIISVLGGLKCREINNTIVPMQKEFTLYTDSMVIYSKLTDKYIKYATASLQLDNKTDALKYTDTAEIFLFKAKYHLNKADSLDKLLKN